MPLVLINIDVLKFARKEFKSNWLRRSLKQENYVNLVQICHSQSQTGVVFNRRAILTLLSLNFSLK